MWTKLDFGFLQSCNQDFCNPDKTQKWMDLCEGEDSKGHCCAILFWGQKSEGQKLFSGPFSTMGSSITGLLKWAEFTSLSNVFSPWCQGAPSWGGREAAHREGRLLASGLFCIGSEKILCKRASSLNPLLHSNHQRAWQTHSDCDWRSSPEATSWHFPVVAIIQVYWPIPS